MYHKTKKAGTEYTFEYAPKLGECTKLRALLTDLRVLRNAERNCMAVVFTHHRETHAALVALLKQHHGQAAGRAAGRARGGHAHDVSGTRP